MTTLLFHYTTYPLITPDQIYTCPHRMHLHCSSFLINQETNTFKLLKKCVICNFPCNLTAVSFPEHHFIQSIESVPNTKPFLLINLLHICLDNLHHKDIPSNELTNILLGANQFFKRDSANLAIGQKIIIVIKNFFISFLEKNKSLERIELIHAFLANIQDNINSESEIEDAKVKDVVAALNKILLEHDLVHPGSTGCQIQLNIPSDPNVKQISDNVCYANKFLDQNNDIDYCESILITAAYNLTSKQALDKLVHKTFMLKAIFQKLLNHADRNIMAPDKIEMTTQIIIFLGSVICKTKKMDMSEFPFMGLFKHLIKCNLHVLFVMVVIYYVSFNFRLGNWGGVSANDTLLINEIQQFKQRKHNQIEDNQELSEVQITKNLSFLEQIAKEEKPSALGSIKNFFVSGWENMTNKFSSNTSEPIIPEPSQNEDLPEQIEEEEQTQDPKATDSNWKFNEIEFFKEINKERLEDLCFTQTTLERNFKINWTELIHLFCLIDDLKKERGGVFQHFKLAYQQVWGPIFGNFLHHDQKFNFESRLATPSDFRSFNPTDFKKLLFESENSEQMLLENDHEILNSLCLNFDLKNFMLEVEPNLRKLYQLNIVKPCSLNSNVCKKRNNIYVCFFCQFYFCSDCLVTSLSKYYLSPIIYTHNLTFLYHSKES